MSVYNARARNLKIARRAMRHRAWLNGVEITRRCFYADVRRGVVRCYRLNEVGQKYVENARVATEELRGRVVVRRIEAA